MKQTKKYFILSPVLLGAFLLWTAAICRLDVQPIGPRGSTVGLAAMNRCVHVLTGVHWGLYTLTDWLGLVPVAVCLAFAGLGLGQWIKRKHLRKVDRSLFVLGGLYALTFALYFLFEAWAVNYRPVLIGGFLEASYPSSTTLLVVSVMASAALELRRRIKHRGLRTSLILAIALFSVFMVIGRLVSGVHWFSDIAGSLLLSAGLVTLYAALSASEE